MNEKRLISIYGSFTSSAEASNWPWKQEACGIHNPRGPNQQNPLGYPIVRITRLSAHLNAGVRSGVRSVALGPRLSSSRRAFKY